MSTTKTTRAGARRGSAKELFALRLAERDAIMLAAAKLAEAEYHGNKDLTDFEAFGEDDLHGESSNDVKG